MARKLLPQILTIVTGLALTAAMFFAVGLSRRSEDTKWCRDATAPTARPAKLGGGLPDVLEKQRSACMTQRQHQRVMFGSVWRTDGRQTAECAFELARLQLLLDEEGRRFILERYGVDPSGFDVSSREDQTRFVEKCRSNPPDATR